MTSPFHSICPDNTWDLFYDEDEEPNAIKGIVIGVLLSLVFFWLPFGLYVWMVS